MRKHEAESIAAEERRWTCETCDRMLNECDIRYCAHCAAYWKDVKDGLFDDDYDPSRDM